MLPRRSKTTNSDGEPVKFQSLETALHAAGFAQFRIVTPKSGTRLATESSRSGVDDIDVSTGEEDEADEEEGEVEALLIGEDAAAAAASSMRERGSPAKKAVALASARLPSSLPDRDPARSDGFEAWTFSLSRAPGRPLARVVASVASQQPAPTRRTISDSSVTSELSCGSLSSSSTTTSDASTVIQSPRDQSVQAFGQVRNSEKAAAAARDRTPQPPRRKITPPSPRTAIPERRAKAPTYQEATPTVAMTEEEVLKSPPSLAAQSLRNISSRKTLRNAPQLKAKASFSLETASAPLRRVLRHATSTPFLSSSAKEDASSPPPVPFLPKNLGPPPPTGASAAVRQSWFATVRNYVTSNTPGSASPAAASSSISSSTSTTTNAGPTSVGTAAPSRRIRTRPSIPNFAGQSPTPITSTNQGTFPRPTPLAPQTTSRSVLCSSEVAADLPAVFIPFPEEQGTQLPEAAPVLLPRPSYTTAKSGVTVSDFVWTADEGHPNFWAATPDGAVSSESEDGLDEPTSPPHAPPPKALNAKRSITSLRAALSAHALAASIASAGPSPALPSSLAAHPINAASPAAVMPTLCVSSPNTIQLGLPPRILDLDEEEFVARRSESKAALMDRMILRRSGTKVAKGTKRIR